MNEPETRPHIGQNEIVTDDEQGDTEPTVEGTTLHPSEYRGNDEDHDSLPPDAQPIAVQRVRAVAVVNPNPLAMLASALEQGHDIAKLEKLMDMAERYEANEARKSFASALSKFQGLVPDIIESKMATVVMTSGGTYTYKYADLDAIMRTIRPTLKKCGLSVRYDSETSEDGKRIRSTCYVMHRDGHTEQTVFAVPIDEGMKVNDSQKMGSANAYACRYNVCNALGLTTGEDDDGGSLHGEDSPARDISKPTPAKAADLDEFFPIGKWKGHRWDEVPLDYLEWAAANLTDKEDIVAACKKAMAARLDSDDQRAHAEAEAAGSSMTTAEAARGIAAATDAAGLAKFWDSVPEKARGGTEAFYKTRAAELTGDDKRGPDDTEDGAPF